MATAVAAISVLIIVLALPLIVLRPQWVFYLFLTVSIFAHVIYGYMAEAGNLGAPRTWTPADVMVWQTLLATFFVRREEKLSTGTIGKCLAVLGWISLFAVVLGFIRNSFYAFSHMRVAYFVAAMIFALKYFTTWERVVGFLKYCAFIILVMFGVQILIRFAIFTPPSAEIEFETQLGGERGAQSLVPILYLVLISIATSRIVNRIGFWPWSYVLLLIGLAGIVLTETRSMYASAAVLALFCMVFLRGRIKTVVFYGLAGFLAIAAAQALGFDFLARFRVGGQTGALALPDIRHTWRAMEYRTIADSYKAELPFIVAGRGIAAFHESPKFTQAYVAFYHSEYLGWLDRCGLIGLFALLVLLMASCYRSFRLARCQIPYLDYYGSLGFLLLGALIVDGLFHPVLSNYRAAPLIVCVFVVLANWQTLREGIYAQLGPIEDEPHLELEEQSYELPYGYMGGSYQF